MSTARGSAVLDCAGRLLVLDRPRIMGIVNVTPDSFSDGGRYLSVQAAVAQGLRLLDEGADLLDVGGESTRPGAAPVSVDEELQRILPVIEELVARTDAPISIDTSKPEVMQAAVAAGAGLINDVCALQQAGALEMAAKLAVPVCLMHMRGDPRSMQLNPHYDDPVDEIAAFFEQRIDACIEAGIRRSRLILDPGFGFGKTLEHNLALLRGLDRFLRFGMPLLAGLSRKAMIGQITGATLEQRTVGSVAAALEAVRRGARIVRVHDVKATADALAVWVAVNEESLHVNH